MYDATDNPEAYLASGEIIRPDEPEVMAAAGQAVEGALGETARASALFYFVRDRILYNPYVPFHKAEYYYPSATLARGQGYCVQKAALLTAMARAVGIPARMVYADIVNRRFSQKLLDYMGTNLFVYHGYVEMFLGGRWIRCTPSFEGPLCDKLDIHPVEFDGTRDAVLHPLDRRDRPHIEYVREIGVHADVPLADIVRAWRETYSPERVDGWIAAFESGQGDPGLRPDRNDA